MNIRFFLPKKDIFFEQLTKMAQAQKEVATIFDDFVTHFPYEETYASKAKEVEHSADDLTHNVIQQLNTTFITPLDREDIFTLVHELDDIVDLIENVINNIFIFNITQQRPELKTFSNYITPAADILLNLVQNLKTQKNTPELQQQRVHLHELEDQGDLAFQNALRAYFQNGENPLEVIKWKDILENLEQIMDKYQRVSDVIEGILVKMS